MTDRLISRSSGGDQLRKQPNRDAVALEKDCVQYLAEDMGLVWEGFDSQPEPFGRASNDAQRVVAGAYSLVAADFSTLEELDQTDLPILFADALGELATRADLEAQSPAGALWYLYFLEAVEEITRAPGDGGQAAMQYQEDTGTIEVFGLEEDAATMIPPVVSSILIHEASHRDYGDHEETCGWGGCDPEPDGPYGVQARWLFDWLVYNSDRIEEADCLVVLSQLDAICTARIVDYTGYTPCELRMTSCD